MISPDERLLMVMLADIEATEAPTKAYAVRHALDLADHMRAVEGRR